MTSGSALPTTTGGSGIPETPLLERAHQLRGWRINKAAMGLGDPVNRAAFLADERSYWERYELTDDELRAVMGRDWPEMIRLGANLFLILKITALDPVRITEIGALQAGMEHEAFLRNRLGKKV